MKLDEILALWTSDAKISEYDLDRESLTIAEKHGKYLNFFLDERAALKKLLLEKRRLYGFLCQYYRGELNGTPELKGRTNWPLKVKYNNIEEYIDQDPEYLTLQKEIAASEDKVSALEEILRSLNNRGFQIKNALEFIKIKSGM